MILLDGAIGTLAASRGFAAPPDILNLSDPGLVAAIHRSYVEAGADILTTNTFLTADPATIRAGVSIARSVADGAERRVLVAGCMGPTADRGTLRRKAELLADAGADILLLETLTDLSPIRALGRRHEGLPLMVSATLGRDGRLLSGETLADLAAVAEEHDAWTVGLNCSYGPSETAGHIRQLAKLTRLPISCHPNAGLPDQTLGLPDQTLGLPDGTLSPTDFAAALLPLSPTDFADALLPLAREGIVHILGGCCGTTPAHIHTLRTRLNTLGK